MAIEGELRESVELTGVTVTFIPTEPGAPYSLLEWEAQVGSPSPPVHVHHKTDEGFYVMAGRFAFLLDGVQTYASPGAHVLVPTGHAHTFWNPGVRLAKCLIILSPSGFEGYFRELAPLLAATDAEDAAVEARRSLSSRYDIEVVGPPVALG
jgi:mannose-6-phosphate isomerase-like protein (cupin superfamily)